MRRKELEVKDISRIKEFLDEYEVMRVGFYDGENVHIFPVNFGYELKDGELTLVFHGAQSGLKAELSKGKPMVSFEMDKFNGQKGEGELACSYTSHYHSVMGVGRIIPIEEEEEKRHVLDMLMSKISGRDGFTYSDESLRRTAAYKIVADKFSAKAK